MESIALEEKINKIRQQNEEIKRRHQEVEEDKRNAAKSNALVQLVPSTDWPDKKDLVYNSAPRINQNKQRVSKEHNSEQAPSRYIGNIAKKKTYTFPEGEGPPPDPKYNFLADSEREEYSTENPRENVSSRGRNKFMNTNPKKKINVKDGLNKSAKVHQTTSRDDHHQQPEYDAWRAERNRIDKDRISRQKTAEGHWRREWDNDKIHVVDEHSKKDNRPTLGDIVKRDQKDFDRRYDNGNKDTTRGSYRGVNRVSSGGHVPHDYRYNKPFDQQYGHATNKIIQQSTNVDKRSVFTTEKGIKVSLNQGTNITKAPVKSVKVNSPNIAGTGRVGPRQRSRLTYSSHSDIELIDRDIDSYLPQNRGNIFINEMEKPLNSRKSYEPKRRENIGLKSPFFQRKELLKQNTSSAPSTNYQIMKRSDNFGLENLPTVTKKNNIDIDFKDNIQNHTQMFDQFFDVKCQRKPSIELLNIEENNEYVQGDIISFDKSEDRMVEVEDIENIQYFEIPENIEKSDENLIDKIQIEHKKEESLLNKCDSRIVDIVKENLLQINQVENLLINLDDESKDFGVESIETNIVIPKDEEKEFNSNHSVESQKEDSQLSNGILEQD